MSMNFPTEAYEYWTRRHSRIKPDSQDQSKLEKAAYGIALEEFFDTSCMDFTVMFSFGFAMNNNRKIPTHSVSREYAVRQLEKFVFDLSMEKKQRQHLVCVWMGDRRASGDYHLHGKLHFGKKTIHPELIADKWKKLHGDVYTSAYIKGGGYGRYGFVLHEDWDFFHVCPNRSQHCKKYERHQCDYIRRTALPTT